MSEEKGGLGKAISDGIGWILDHASVNGTLVLIGIIVVAYVGWQASLVFGPSKVCWRCKGSGHRGGILGGRRKCPSCDGGLRRRIGAK